MAITQAITTSYKVEALMGKHKMRAAGGHQFKMALYTSSATLSAATTDYATSNEVTGTGYSAGGANLTSVDPTSTGTTAIMDFNDVAWATATFTARGALIYNTETDGASSTTEAVQVLDFGVDKSVTAGTFTVQFPTPGATTAIIQIR